MTGVILAIILLLLPIILLLLFDRGNIKKKAGAEREEAYYKPDNIFEECRRIVNEVLNSDYSELGLNRAETVKREKQQNRLRNAIREACLGDAGDREYLKEYLKELLQNRMGIGEKNINKIIPFDNPSLMSAQDKFEYMYVQYSEKYGPGSFLHMVMDFSWDMPKENGKGTAYCITEDDNGEYQCKVYAHMRIISDIPTETGKTMGTDQNIYGYLYPVKKGYESGTCFTRSVLGPLYLDYKPGEWLDYYVNTSGCADFYGSLCCTNTERSIMIDYSGLYPWLVRFPFLED